MALPEEHLQAAINNEVTGEGSEATFARRLERNFANLDQRLGKAESTLNSQWFTVLTGNGRLISTTTTLHWFATTALVENAVAATGEVPIVNTADYPSTEWRIRVSAATNSTDPDVTFTVHAYEITSGGASYTYTATGSSLASVDISPGASTVTGATGSRSIIGDKYIALAVLASAAPAAGSETILTALLQVRNPS